MVERESHLKKQMNERECHDDESAEMNEQRVFQTRLQAMFQQLAILVSVWKLQSCSQHDVTGNKHQEDTIQ